MRVPAHAGHARQVTFYRLKGVNLAISAIRVPLHWLSVAMAKLSTTSLPTCSFGCRSRPGHLSGHIFRTGSHDEGGRQ